MITINATLLAGNLFYGMNTDGIDVRESVFAYCQIVEQKLGSDYTVNWNIDWSAEGAEREANIDAEDYEAEQEARDAWDSAREVDYDLFVKEAVNA